jgi:hypothetical protein
MRRSARRPELRAYVWTLTLLPIGILAFVIAFAASAPAAPGSEPNPLLWDWEWGEYADNEAPHDISPDGLGDLYAVINSSPRGGGEKTANLVKFDREGYESFPKGVDAAPLFKGLPGDMCQSSHWGYILKGRMRVKRASGDEVLRAGDVYYLEPGHVPVFEEDTEILEFSPKAEYERTVEVVARNMASMKKEE